MIGAGSKVTASTGDVPEYFRRVLRVWHERPIGLQKREEGETRWTAGGTIMNRTRIRDLRAGDCCRSYGNLIPGDEGQTPVEPPIACRDAAFVHSFCLLVAGRVRRSLARTPDREQDAEVGAVHAAVIVEIPDAILDPTRTPAREEGLEIVRVRDAILDQIRGAWLDRQLTVLA